MTLYDTDFKTWSASEAINLRTPSIFTHRSHTHAHTISLFILFVCSLHSNINIKWLFEAEPRWNWTIRFPAFLSSFLCDWINYVSLTLLEVSKHTFSVISHQSMWPWRWKVKHVSQEAGQRGISPLISGPTQSHHSLLLPWELKLSLWAMYSALYTLHLWCVITLAVPIKKKKVVQLKINVLLCGCGYSYPV